MFKNKEKVQSPIRGEKGKHSRQVMCLLDRNSIKMPTMEVGARIVIGEKGNSKFGAGLA